MNRTPPTLDMRIDGSFRAPPRVGVPLSFKLMMGGIFLALTAGAIAFAAFALWIFSMALPVLLIGGAFAFGMFRYRRWQAGRANSKARSVY